MKETIVLYPSASSHHMVSLVELGKLIIQHHPHLTITILVSTIPSEASATSSYIDHLSKTNLPISFHSLPSIHLPPPQHSHDIQAQIVNASKLILLTAPHVVDSLRTISLSSSVLALITSVVHPYSDDTLNIPTYYYCTSCASTLALFLYLPTLHGQTTKSFKDLGSTLLHIPGLPPIKASDMPQPLLQRDDPTYHFFLNNASSLPKSKGFIVNTFDSLEPLAIKAIADGACVPNGLIPPVYPIGPLITDAKDRASASSSSDASSECLDWLDTQPSRSVVFLCFGRKGTFSEEQHEKIAIGLERSNQRFLWVVKSPQGSTTTEPNLEVILPKGFLERTKERGLVVKSWAPQSEILSHEAVGGFVTHCGWNSVLEAVSHGVAMVAWPLYAEQHANAVVLVEEMKLAIPINMATSSEEEVSSEEVETSVRKLMELEEGKILRKRSLDMRAMARAAWTSGGTSFAAFSNLVASWKLG
ncbi:UDP-glycosyltransferase 88B1-like [Corylus avellana]|uniref:UDP-glycosyltransferase 88B1-like n=1 Tax=Corylus avellana TaxID=13451 RepID=UPI00286D2D57|nr:UDP-glycosyltransferase 88B1-like [Corylus avellana]